MRKSIEAIKGDKLQNIRNEKIVIVEDVMSTKLLVIEEETGVAKIVAKATIRRWYKMYEEYVEPVQEETQEEIEEVELSENIEVKISTTPNLVETEQSPVTTIVNNTVVQGNLLDVLNAFECEAIQKKEYLGIYKQGYRGTVCMLRTSRTGNRHIDMKQKVFDALPSEYKQYLQEKYTCGIYDRSRGYFRIQNCEDLNVIQKVIECALQLG